MSRSVLKARKARSTWARALQEETTSLLSRSPGSTLVRSTWIPSSFASAVMDSWFRA